MRTAVILLICIGVASAIRLQKRRDQEECPNKESKEEWITEGNTTRLKGPVFFFHVSHHSGRGFQILAHAPDVGDYHTMEFGRWQDIEDANAGKPTKTWGVSDGYSMYEDKSWTSIEENFGNEDKPGHTLDEIGCGTKGPRILATSIRHPVENLLGKAAWEQPNIKKNGLMGACESDNVYLRYLAGKGCSHLEADQCAPLTRDDLEFAKARARKMDVIFVLGHLPETIKLGCSRLGWKTCERADMVRKHKQIYSKELLDSMDQQSWDQLFERNKLGIELFEYMRDLSFDMLKKDGLPQPTEEEKKENLPVLESLEKAKFLADHPPVALKEEGVSFLKEESGASSKWHCGR